MIKWITLLFCMSMSMMLCAQVTIHGTVKNQSGAPLVNASIIISPVGSSKVIAFKMTDGKGALPSRYSQVSTRYRLSSIYSIMKQR